ncbi:hypothetical protein PGT21_007652 [Puccinia graminis f. sp. tritici]|uniref:Uncharacterized protein n=1 Tax=Puccinia graminis f. sp. tritici TaxID=56615 RepID=A0A5B0Q2B5_PUCGR|nr:hypothetical protein PGT21_007652 [Puccinia graminis f. sp. tritici]KAA1124940.1 hypothetical protein PGTUg99_037005 [Puccinia graminis f. sp. tritici]
MALNFNSILRPGMRTEMFKSVNVRVFVRVTTPPVGSSEELNRAGHKERLHPAPNPFRRPSCIIGVHD